MGEDSIFMGEIGWDFSLSKAVSTNTTPILKYHKLKSENWVYLQEKNQNPFNLWKQIKSISINYKTIVSIQNLKKKYDKVYYLFLYALTKLNLSRNESFTVYLEAEESISKLLK